MASFKVNEEDINAYIRFKSLLSKDDSFEVKSVFPFPSEDKPFLYVINYSDSWEIISSDKRTAAVISSGEGEFDPHTENESMISWINYLGETVYVLSETNQIPKNGEDYIQFWNLLRSIDIKPDTRSGPDTLNHPVPGHYELLYADTTNVTTDIINHLIHTKWGQSEPFNQYCPIDSSRADYPRCLAGCIPVACGQIIYYYHYIGDACPEVYDSAYCNTREYDQTDWGQMCQWHKHWSNWSKFQTADSLRMAAVLLANIGKSIMLRYHWDFSSLPTIYPLQDYLLSEFGFDSFYSRFYSPYFNPYDYLLELLQEGYPSIISIYDTSLSNHNGHALILDRYQKKRLSYVYQYSYIPDDPDIISLPEWDVTYIYQYPEVLYFGMNWGFSGLYDSSWYISSSDWIIPSYTFNQKFEIMTFRNDGGYPGSGEEGGQSIITPLL